MRLRSAYRYTLLHQGAWYEHLWPGRYSRAMPTSPGPLLHTLDALWARLRRSVPDLPPATFAVLSTAPTTYHSAERWVAEDDGALTFAVHVQTLREGSTAVLAYVLHDAAHVLCWARRITDTAGRGRYHSGAYLSAAEEIGLRWPAGGERGRDTGYAGVIVPPDLAQSYVDIVSDLDRDIPLAIPHVAAPRSASRTPSRITMACECLPARTFRISPTQAAKGAIGCGVCGKTFTEQ